MEIRGMNQDDLKKFDCCQKLYSFFHDDVYYGSYDMNVYSCFVLENAGQIVALIAGEEVKRKDQLWQGINDIISMVACNDEDASRLIDYMIEYAWRQKRRGCIVNGVSQKVEMLEKYGFRKAKKNINRGDDMILDFQRINLTKLSRYISFVLRHHPEEIGATVNEQGWMKVDELLKGMKAKGKYINKTILEEIVFTDEKQRYHFNEDHTMIRAAQGHSIPVYIDMEIKIPPRYLYHGTSKQNYEKIKVTKLKKMNRLYVHLSKDVKTACQVGKRHGLPVVLVLDTKAMLKDGYQFYVAANGVWLCDDVDCRYIVQVIEQFDESFPRK